MEERPPTEAGQDVPRSRSPRAPFGTPDQPAPPGKPAERAPRRAKAAPPVTFQPPSSASDAEPPGRPPRKTSSGTGSASPDATPGPERSEQASESQRKTAPRKSQTPRPSKVTPPSEATPAESAPVSAESVPPQPVEPEPGGAEPSATVQAVPPRPRRAEAQRPRKAAPEPASSEPAEDANTTTPVKAAKATPIKKAARKATRPARHTAAPADAELLNAEPATPAPTKKTQPAKATSVKSEPAEEATPIFAALSSESATRGTAAQLTPERTEAWAKLVADPGHAPELLALAAVQAIGPRAGEWARRTREAYPTATDAGLARLATMQFTRFGSLSSIFGAVAGSYAPIALLGAAAFTHAQLILHVAAAYGLEPTDEARATDLLVLTRVHPSREDAEAALATARQPAYEEGGLTDAAWRLGRMVAAQTGGWAAIRLVNRFFPGTSILVATLTSRSAAENVAARANTYYSQESQALGSKV